MPKKKKVGIKRLIASILNFKNKNNKSKQVIVSCLAIIMIFGTIGVISLLFRDSYAVDLATGESGTCVWTRDEEGKLTIEPANGSTTCTLVSSTRSSDVPWYDYRASITSIEVKQGVKTNTSAAYLFYDIENATEIDVTKLDTSSATDMNHMFSGCFSIPSLDLSNFNTSNVTDMSSMFYNCSFLTSLNLSGFNTSNVTDMSYMFCYCEDLTSLNISSFNTSSVTNMERMFMDCFNLAELDLSNFNMNAIEGSSKISNMFKHIGKYIDQGCKLILNDTFNNYTYAHDAGYYFPWQYYAKETNGTLENTLYSLTDMQTETVNSNTPTTWVPAYSVTYDKGTGDSVSGTPNPQIYRIGTNIDTRGYSASKENEIFIYWTSSLSTYGADTIGNNTKSNVSYGSKYNVSAISNGNVTLYAQYGVMHTLTLHANGGTIPQTTGWTGSGNTATKQVAYGTSIGTIPKPTRSGYVFDGWFDAPENGSFVYPLYWGEYSSDDDLDAYAQWYYGLAKGRSGSCGWKIDHNGKLTIYDDGYGGGIGERSLSKGVSSKATYDCKLANSAGGTNPYPWHEYKTQITSVEVEAGVHAAEDSTGLFKDLTNVTEIDASYFDMTTSYNSTDLFTNVGSNLAAGTKLILNLTFNSTCTATYGGGGAAEANIIKDIKTKNLANGDQCDPLASLPWNYYAKETSGTLGNTLYDKTSMYSELDNLSYEDGPITFVPSYSVTYNKGTGDSISGTPNPKVYRIGSNVNTTGYSAAKENSTFDNWNTALNGNGTTLAKNTQTSISFADKYNTSALSEGNVSLYAQFTSNEFTPAITMSIPNEKSLYKTGDKITYNIVVTNNESFAITNVVVSDPNGTMTNGTGYTVNNTHQATIANIPAGESVTISVTKTIEESDVNTFTNTATITEAEAANGATLEGTPRASKSVNVQSLIKITKQVKGNIAKLSEYFKVKIIIGGVTGDKYTISGQSYTGEGKQTTYTVGEDNYIYLKSGETITIGDGASDSRIPGGIIYQVVENTNTYNTYINGSSTNSKDSGDLTTSTTTNTNEVSIINSKEAQVPTERRIKYIPYVIAILLVAIGITIIVRKIYKRYI